jgi:hypothetical protein
LRFRRGNRSPAPRGERDDDRERRPLARIDLADPSVDVGAPEPPVDGDHLAVERVQCPEAEVAVPSELGEADVALVGTVKQGADRRGLKQDRRIGLGMDRRPLQRLDVEGPGETDVEHACSLASVPVTGFGGRVRIFRERWP